MKYIVLACCIILGVSVSYFSYADTANSNLKETIRMLQSMLLNEKEYLYEKNKDCAKLHNFMFMDMKGSGHVFDGQKAKITKTYFSKENYACMYDIRAENQNYTINFFTKEIQTK